MHKLWRGGSAFCYLSISPVATYVMSFPWTVMAFRTVEKTTWAQICVACRSSSVVNNFVTDWIMCGSVWCWVPATVQMEGGKRCRNCCIVSIIDSCEEEEEEEEEDGTVLLLLRKDEDATVAAADDRGCRRPLSRGGCSWDTKDIVMDN